MAKRDYYEILGVARDAAEKQIKSAYRRLARKFHPDVNKEAGASDRFREATEAYDVLSDREKRRAYDAYGHAGVSAGVGNAWSQQAAGPRVNFRDIFGGAQSAFAGLGLDELLQRLRGKPRGDNGGARRGGRKGLGEDTEYELDLTLEEALTGTMRTIRVRRGSPDGQSHDETLNVRIPRGVEDGGRVRVRGKGKSGPAGAGDLFIVIRIRPHAWLRREGDDLFVDLPLTIAEATLGTVVDVPTLEGMAQVRVPPGTPSGRKLRLRGKGAFRRGGDERGDLYATIQIVPPTSAGPAAAELLRQFEQSAPASPRRRPPWV